jgi:hypothetical protein
VTSDFMSILLDPIPEVIPSRICHVNMGPVLSGYEATYRNSR